MASTSSPWSFGEPIVSSPTSSLACDLPDEDAVIETTELQNLCSPYANETEHSNAERNTLQAAAHMLLQRLSPLTVRAYRCMGRRRGLENGRGMYKEELFNESPLQNLTEPPCPSSRPVSDPTTLKRQRSPPKEDAPLPKAKKPRMLAPFAVGQVKQWPVEVVHEEDLRRIGGAGQDKEDLDNPAKINLVVEDVEKVGGRIFRELGSNLLGSSVLCTEDTEAGNSKHMQLVDWFYQPFRTVLNGIVRRMVGGN